MALALVGAGYTVKNPPALVFLCIAAALAQRSQIEVTGAHKVSISLFPIMLAAVLCGPIGAMAVSVASMLGEETRPLHGWSYTPRAAPSQVRVAGVVAASV